MKEIWLISKTAPLELFIRLSKAFEFVIDTDFVWMIRRGD